MAMKSTMANMVRTAIMPRSEDGKAVSEAVYWRDDYEHPEFTYGQYAPIAPTNGDVICSTVLPGFQFRISDLHRQPTLITMAEDGVYRNFVLPEYQAQKARADRLAARLRELGIAEDELE